MQRLESDLPLVSAGQTYQKELGPAESYRGHSWFLLSSGCDSSGRY
jgi:hypothetical protein